MLSSSDTKCYKASPFTEKLNFKDAMEKCGSMNAKLAEPMNTEENENIATKLSGTAAFSRYWIGISDKDTEGTFKYASDASEVEFTSWRRGQPNNRWPKLDCTAFKNGEWNTANCENREFPYICQMDISEDDDNSDNAGESDEIDLASMINVMKAKLEEVEAKVEYNIEKIDEDKEKLDQLGAEVDFNSEKLRPFQSVQKKKNSKKTCIHEYIESL